MVEQRVVHLPVTALFARSLCCFGRQHRIRVNSDERKMMELEPELLRIPVQDFLHQRVVGSTARTLVIPELHQRQRGLLGATNMPATLNICAGRRGGFFRLIRLTAQVNGSAGSQGYSQDDHNQGLQGFWHAAIVTALEFFCKKYLAKNILQWVCPEVKIASSRIETNFLVEVGYSSQGP